MIQENNLAHTK